MTHYENLKKCEIKLLSKTEKQRRQKISKTLKQLFKTGKRVPWNKGLTKTSSSKIKEISVKISKSLKGKTAWSKGLTKETDERLRKMWKNRRRSWNEGLTKETDERLKRQGEKMKEVWSKHPERFINMRGKANITLGKHKPTYIEILMTKILDSARVEYDFQHPITYTKGSGHVKWIDFYLPNHKLCIECDGEEWHKDKEADNRRDEIILSVLGSDWRIEHISGKEIFEWAKFFGFRK